MVLIDNEFKDILINKLNKILYLDNENWNKMDKKYKLKYIHHLCACIENNKINNLEPITIPLKSIKPKKLIQFCKISKLNNKNLYLQFQTLILDYVRDFRNKYINIKKRIYYTYNSLPINDYNNILYEYNKIIYTFINKNKIDINNLLKLLIGNNYDKLLFDNNNYNNEYKFNYSENIINLITNNFTICFTLRYTTNNITNNISVKYIVKIINNI